MILAIFKRTNLIYLGIAFLLTACQSSLNLRELLTPSDTIELVFYEIENTQKADTVYIKSKQLIRDFVKAIKPEPQAMYKCGYYGKMRFLRQNFDYLILEAEFNHQESCPHIRFSHEGKDYVLDLAQNAYETIELAQKHQSATENID